MKKVCIAATGLALGASSAIAGGLDRSGQPIGVLFETGNYVELSYGFANPRLTGRDVLGNPVADVGGSFSIVGGGIKMDLDEKFSFAVIFDQPYGADVLYGGSPATTMLGGTSATADSTSLTGLLRYRLNDRISIYGGPRYLEAEGRIALSGLAYGPASGYDVRFGSTSGWGYVAGASYEIPAIALRAALTYQSGVDLDFPTQENIVPFASADTKSEAPQSVTLDLQTGIAKDTLLFGSVRWAEWSAFSLTPQVLGANLAQLDDVTTYSIGLGRRFTEKFAGTASFTYESGGSDDLVSPLAPSNGQKALTIGGRYDVSDRLTVSGGVRYTWLGDARPETGTPDTARASFTDNDAVSIGLRIGYHF